MTLPNRTWDQSCQDLADHWLEGSTPKATKTQRDDLAWQIQRTVEDWLDENEIESG